MALNLEPEQSKELPKLQESSQARPQRSKPRRKQPLLPPQRLGPGSAAKGARARDGEKRDVILTEHLQAAPGAPPFYRGEQGSRCPMSALCRQAESARGQLCLAEPIHSSHDTPWGGRQLSSCRPPLCSFQSTSPRSPESNPKSLAPGCLSPTARSPWSYRPPPFTLGLRQGPDRSEPLTVAPEPPVLG